MGKYLKQFETHQQYEAYTADTSNFITPNVSYCIDTPNEVHYNPFVDPYAGHEFVDLGLSVKWAKMNIGASSETDYGQYFSWGDISGYTASQVGSGEGQKYFGWADYKYGNGTSSPGATGMTKYNSTDGKTTLEASDDAAVANMEGLWRMPTEAEFNELCTASTITKGWTTVNGVKGYKFSLTADPTKYVFFPAAGNCDNGSVNGVGSNGYYWSSSLYTDNLTYGRYLRFGSGNCYISNYNRCGGFSVRGVVG